MISMMFDASIRVWYLTTFTSGLSAWIDSSAESTLGMPIALRGVDHLALEVG